MKIVIVLTLALLSILLVASSTCLTRNIEPAPQENRITASNQPNTAKNGNASPTNNNVETKSSQPSGSARNGPARNSESTNEAVSNGFSAETPSDQNTLNAPENETASANVPPPDGRVYSGGEAPYAYVPTYSPKEKGLPIIPLTPGE
jgi:hypothetical protein